MNDSILNTPTEAAFRLLLLFSVIPDGTYNQQWLSAIDFMCIYGEMFDLCEKNLHGDSWMKFTEYAMRTWNIRDALHDLAAFGWITAVPTQRGFVYQITQSGRSMALCFSTSYAEPYRKNAAQCYELFGSYTEKELDLLIRHKALVASAEEKEHD